MAQKRMFDRDIIASDDFCNFSKDAQLLYFFLGMEADDDGFLKSTKRICRTYDIEEKYLEELAEKEYIIRFESGVVCITDWKINNYIRKDRYKPTIYIERNLVELMPIDENRSRWTLKGTKGDFPYLEGGLPAINQPSTNGIPTINRVGAQYSIDKVKSVKNRLGEQGEGVDNFIPPWIHEAFGQELTKNDIDMIVQASQQYGESKVNKLLQSMKELRAKQRPPYSKPLDMKYFIALLNQYK